MTISIIICVYNEEEKISRCIDSVRTQTYSNWELWIIDDGSTDGTAEIVKKYEATDERIHLYSQENQGISLARKTGIICATGEFLTFIDADDYVGELYLEHFLEVLRTYPKAECIQGGHLRYENGNITNISASAIVQYPPSVAITLPFHPRAIWAMLWQTSILKQHLEHLPEHLDLAEDIVITLQLYPHLKSVYFSPSADYHYFIHGKNISYACHSEKMYAQVATDIINAVNQDYWKRSKFAFSLQINFIAKFLKALANSSLSTQQSISLLQKLPSPLLSRDFFSRSLGYGSFIYTWLLKHKHYKTLLTLAKLRFKEKNSLPPKKKNCHQPQIKTSTSHNAEE